MTISRTTSIELSGSSALGWPGILDEGYLRSDVTSYGFVEFAYTAPCERVIEKRPEERITSTSSEDDTFTPVIKEMARSISTTASIINDMLLETSYLSKLSIHEVWVEHLEMFKPFRNVIKITSGVLGTSLGAVQSQVFEPIRVLADQIRSAVKDKFDVTLEYESEEVREVLTETNLRVFCLIKEVFGDRDFYVTEDSRIKLIVWEDPEDEDVWTAEYFLRYSNEVMENIAKEDKFKSMYYDNLPPYCYERVLLNFVYDD